MTVKEKLLEEFACAITAVLGDNSELEEDNYQIESIDIEDICKKVKFYLDL